MATQASPTTGTYSMVTTERVVFDFVTPGHVSPRPAVLQAGTLEALIDAQGYKRLVGAGVGEDGARRRARVTYGASEADAEHEGLHAATGDVPAGRAAPGLLVRRSFSLSRHHPPHAYHGVFRGRLEKERSTSWPTGR